MKLFHMLTLLVATLMPTSAILAADSVPQDHGPGFYAVDADGIFYQHPDTASPGGFDAVIPDRAHAEILALQEKISRKAAASPALRSRPDYLVLYSQPAMNDQKRTWLKRTLLLTKLRISDLDQNAADRLRHRETRADLI